MFSFFKTKGGPCKFCGKQSPQILKDFYQDLFYHEHCMEKRRRETKEENRRKERREKIDLIKQALREFEEEKKQ